MISENNLTKPVVCKAPGSVSLPVQKASLKQDKKCKKSPQPPGPKGTSQFLLLLKQMKRRRLLCQARCSEQFMSQFLAAKILLLILANGNSSKCSRRSQMSLFPLTNGTQHSSSGRNVRRCCVVTGPDGSAVIMMVSV